METYFQQLAESLAPPTKYVEQCKAVADEIFRLVQTRSKYDADRSRVVGGLAKKTSTIVKIDADLVIFVNVVPGNVLVTKKKVLEDWLDILLMNTNLKEDEIKKSPFSLQFSFKNVEVDLLVAINFASDPVTQQKLVMKHIKSSQDPRKVSDQMSAELTELALDFMKDKSKFCHDLARLAKFWSQTIYHTEYVSGKSMMMEMMGVKVAMENERRTSGQPDYLGAFKAFLKMVMDLSTIKLVFYDHYQKTDVPRHISSQEPLMLDPTNPLNNLLFKEAVARGDGNNNDEKGSTFLTLFRDCAKNTLMSLDGGLAWDQYLFLPQPLMWKMPRTESAVVPENYLVGSDDYHDFMPKLVVRTSVSPRVKHSLDNLLKVYTCTVKAAEVQNPRMSLTKVRKKVENTVNKMENWSHEWVTATDKDKYEERAVTLMIPLMGCNKNKAMFVSFDINKSDH